MSLTKEWKEDQEKALKIAGEIELNLAIFFIKERSGKDIRRVTIFAIFLLLSSFLARRPEASLREDISLAILSALLGTAMFLFAKGCIQIREVQKDLNVFLKECAQNQDPGMETALAIVIQRGNFPAWRKQIIEARRKSWEANMKQNPPKE